MSQENKIAKLIESFPDDGTDWDGVHDNVMLKILECYVKAEKFDTMLKNGLMPTDKEWVGNQIHVLLEKEKENKQLKEENDSLGEQLQEATHREKNLKKIVDKTRNWQKTMENESKNPAQETNHSFQPSAINYYLKEILGEYDKVD